MASDMTICYGQRLEDPDMTILLLFVGRIQTHRDGTPLSSCATCASLEENCGSGKLSCK